VRRFKMGILRNLAYRIERMVTFMERGIVVKVESVPKVIDGKPVINVTDMEGKSAERITFRNPLGEVVTKLSPVKPKYTRDDHYIMVHPDYKPGDKFP